MRAVVQRVSRARVRVRWNVTGEITEAVDYWRRPRRYVRGRDRLAERISNLRIFEDDSEK